MERVNELNELRTLDSGISLSNFRLRPVSSML